MVLSAYHAVVECRGSFEPRESCATILDEMEVTQTTEIFGPGSDPTAQIKLPAVIEASKMLCCSSSALPVYAHIDARRR